MNDLSIYVPAREPPGAPPPCSSGQAPCSGRQKSRSARTCAALAVVGDREVVSKRRLHIHAQMCAMLCATLAEVGRVSRATIAHRCGCNSEGNPERKGDVIHSGGKCHAQLHILFIKFSASPTYLIEQRPVGFLQNPLPLQQVTSETSALAREGDGSWDVDCVREVCCWDAKEICC